MSTKNPLEPEKVALMTKTDKQAEFITLRASGQSLRDIAKTLGVSKSTLGLWEGELKAKVAEHKAERLNELYDNYGLYKEARITALGKTLKNIDGELATRDLKDVPSDKLLDYKLKYTSALTEEFISPNHLDESGQELDSSIILNRVDNLYTRVRKGETTKEQASAELMVLTGLMRNYESTELADQINKLERAISQ